MLMFVFFQYVLPYELMVMFFSVFFYYIGMFFCIANPS